MLAACDAVTYTDFLNVWMTFVLIALTALVVVVAAVGIFGAEYLRKSAVRAAEDIVTSQIGDIAKAEVQSYMDMNGAKEVQSYMDMNLEKQVQKYMDVNMSQPHEQESRSTEVIRDE